MKKLSLLLVLALLIGLFAGCSDSATSTPDVPATTPADSSPVDAPATPAGGLSLTVVTSYGGDDGNRTNYENAYKAYEAASGNTVLDASGTSNEEWKAKIMTDFETGAEPDVLFYFNGIDSNKLVENSKVVSIDEVRTVYPDFASNMKDDLMGASPVDGKNYSVPVNGFWEGLFVNKTVLEQAGVEVPGAGYTWEQFLIDCQKIKDTGFTPIAASLAEVPHYWFEFTIFNHDTVETHVTIPVSATDAAGVAWTSGLGDIKDLYDRGFFPANTTTATDGETFQLMADDKAAFAIDGSWKLGWFEENADPNNFVVTYVPFKGERQSTDIIGGISMGYFITRKAWEDPEKQAAAVEFVQAMTSDAVVTNFGSTSVTALKNGTVPPSDTNGLVASAIGMTKGATGIAPAAQDGLNQQAREALFSEIVSIVNGSMTAEDVVTKAIA